MDIVNLLISLASGAAGGNIAAAALPEDKNLGTLGNTISGLIGGGAGHYILQILGVLAQAGVATAAGTAAAGSGFDVGSLLANIGASGASGAILTAIVGLIKSSMQK